MQAESEVGRFPWTMLRRKSWPRLSAFPVFVLWLTSPCARAEEILGTDPAAPGHFQIEQRFGYFSTFDPPAQGQNVNRAAKSSLATAQAGNLKFLNRTGVTIVNLQFAPPASGAWGPNQCKNDDEGEVDHNERLTLTGIQAGRYDVRLGDKKGRVCTIKNVDVQKSDHHPRTGLRELCALRG